METRPDWAPDWPCWGVQYEEGDDECKECSFQDSCKAEIFKKESMRQSSSSVPMPPSSSFSPPPRSNSWESRKWAPAPPPTYNAYPRYTPVTAQQPSYSQAPTVSSLEYGQMVHGQFDGETVGTRIVKNIMLRSAEAAVLEVWRFLNQYPWPPK